MRTAEIAKRYLDYFAKNGHMVVPSASLISPNPTTLFTIAGMVPFIPYLLGEQTPPSRRMASNQKCVRTLDIDEVGKTTRHGTFFQMVGNFSFGDYFKEEAIHYAWELLTTPQDKGGYGFDPEKLWVTTYTDDDEARAIWKNEGFDPEHMQVFGMEDNFWTTGGPGPGGPCSEIYVDRGPKYGRDGGPAADESRFIEIWDLVFENYQVDNVKSKTDLHIAGELDQKNIDTGAGLERLAYLMQGKENIYETDEVYPVIEAAEKLSGVKYGDNNDADVRFRVVADHVRSALMIMSDGVRPSNVTAAMCFVVFFAELFAQCVCLVCKIQFCQRFSQFLKLLWNQAIQSLMILSMRLAKLLTVRKTRSVALLKRARLFSIWLLKKLRKSTRMTLWLAAPTRLLCTILTASQSS